MALRQEDQDIALSSAEVRCVGNIAGTFAMRGTEELLEGLEIPWRIMADLDYSADLQPDRMRPLLVTDVRKAEKGCERGADDGLRVEQRLWRGTTLEVGGYGW